MKGRVPGNKTPDTRFVYTALIFVQKKRSFSPLQTAISINFAYILSSMWPETQNN